MRLIQVIKNFIANITRVVSYLPIIWKDRDWDHTFILILLQFKLKRVHKYLKQQGLREFSRTEDRKFKATLGALERLIDEDYIETEWKAHFDKFPPIIESTCNGTITITQCGNTEKINKERRILSTKEQHLREFYTDLFFDYFKKHHTRWWD
jgi:hypothetical protein